MHAVVYWGRLLGATWVGSWPSHTLRNAFYRSVLGICLPRDSIIYWKARFFGHSGLSIGHHSIIGDGAFLDMRNGITIGDHVNIASEVRIWTAEHDIESLSLATTGGAVVISDRAFLGSRVTVLPGVTIGEGTVVGAGAVVTKDLPAWTVCFGTPARPVRERRRDEYVVSTSERALFQ